jgi:hypothetical protein
MIAHGRWSGYPPRPMIVGVFIHRRLEIQCPIEFLIDTGADRTLIAPEYQAILRIPDNELTPYTTPVRTLGGNQYFSYLSDCILVFPSDTPKSLCYKNLNLFFYSPRRKLGFLHPLHKQNPIEWQGKFPSILGRDVLSEDFISTFFNVPAVVEVYLTTQLTKEEIGLFQFHLGELYRAGVATDVFFAGERIDEKGSVLRFQGNSFEEIYKVLPDLLAPFRMLKAIDFRMTVENIPPKDREEVIVELVRLETSTPSRRWQVAGRLAEIFESFRNAKVYRIAEKGSRGIRIDVFTDERVAKKLSHQGLAEVWDGNRPLSIVTNGSNTIIQM